MPTTVDLPRDETEAVHTGHRVLVVEDDAVLRGALAELLRDHGYPADFAENGKAGLHELESELYDLILLDLNLPQMGGMEVLAAGRGLQTDARFIVMTAFGSVETAVEAMKLGAFDYIEKPFRTSELLLLMERALEDLELRRELARLRTRDTRDARPRMVGRSAAMSRVWSLIERVAPTRATVLISGETGTGKELVAQAIHAASERARGPLVAVNCSALPETLLESELFGHVKGAFTGAVQSKRGLFEEASSGTLFLDEASAMTQGTQVKLLRALQERRVQRVGGRHTIPVDFRLIVATNADLGALVEQGAFRLDLYYRLNVFPIHVPALRERRSDIPLLANHFRLRFAEENGLEAPVLHPETIRRMMSYDWPGNVRELENFMERAVIMHAGAESIPFGEERDETAGPGDPMIEHAVSEGWNLERLEREFILASLESHRWHKTATAAALGIDRKTLGRKLKRYEVD